MYRSSLRESRGCSCGLRYIVTQKKIGIALNSPVERNAACQLKRFTIQGTTSGVSVAPRLVPELNTPVASARSLLGNHSATVLTAAGKLPASPTPSATRATPNPSGVRARACAAAERLQIPIDSA